MRLLFLLTLTLTLCTKATASKVAMRKEQPPLLINQIPTAGPTTEQPLDALQKFETTITRRPLTLPIRQLVTIVSHWLAAILLSISGDVHPNPGPGLCSSCSGRKEQRTDGEHCPMCSPPPKQKRQTKSTKANPFANHEPFFTTAGVHTAPTTPTTSDRTRGSWFALSPQRATETPLATQSIPSSQPAQDQPPPSIDCRELISMEMEERRRIGREATLSHPATISPVPRPAAPRQSSDWRLGVICTSCGRARHDGRCERQVGETAREAATSPGDGPPLGSRPSNANVREQNQNQQNIIRISTSTTNAASLSTTDQQEPKRQCPWCPYAPAARVGPQLVIHINSVHHGRSDATPQQLANAGICFCPECGEAISDSNAGRNAHHRKGCNTFVSRNTRIRNSKVRFSTQLSPDNAIAEPVEIESATASRAAARNLPILDISDEEFFSQRPATIRHIKRWNWTDWASLVLRDALRGYSSSSTEGRIRKQHAFIQMVRQRMSKSKAADQIPGDGSSCSAAKVEALVDMGAYSKASATLLQSAKPAVLDEATMEKLRKLHPTAPDVLGDNRGLELHEIPAISEDEVSRVIRSKLTRGAAPGLDGWTRELLIPLVNDTEALTELTALVQDIASGVTSSSVTDRLMASPLIALDKEDGGIRPIAIESTIIKLVAHIALERIREDTWRQVFPDLQYGAGHGANLERAIRKARQSIASNKISFLVDCHNAFNTVDREAILTQLQKHKGLWPISRLAAWSLRHTRLIPFSNGVAAPNSNLTSQSGVRQGSVIGPLLFCLALQPILHRIKNTMQVDIEAYMDDITLSCADPQTASTALSTLTRELEKIGLKLNVTKTICLADDESASALTGLAREIPRVSSGVVKLLGAAAWQRSTDQERSDFVLRRMKKHDPFFERLNIVGLSYQLALTQMCATGRPIFLLRNHTWEDSAAAACHFDALTEKCLKTIAGEDAQLSDIASLPTRLGGLGLRSAHDLAEICSVSLTKGSQHTATLELDEVKLSSIRATMSDRDRQLLRSFASVNFRGVRPPDDAFRTYMRERLFLPIVAQGTRCCCGAELDAPHIHTCPSLGAARIRRHDALKMLLSKYAARRFSVRVEPSRILSTSRARPDLAIMMPDGQVHVDVSYTYMGLARQDPLGARVKEKAAKYAAHVENFVPFVVGSTGEFHAEATSLVARLLHHRWEREAARAELLTATILGNSWLLHDALA